MKSFRWTFVFIAVVGALVAFTYWDYQKSQKEDEKTEAAKNVVRTPTDQLVRVEILKRGSKLTLEKQDEKWRLVEPVQDFADAQAVATFFLSLRNEKTIATVAEGSEIASLQAFGLEEPVARLRLTAADGKVEELKIGAKAYDSNLYAQIGDEPKVLLVSSSWDIHLAKSANDVRDKHLLRRELKIDDIKRISLKSIDGSDTSEFELAKVGDRWTVTKGAPEFPVVADKVTFYLDAIKGVRAQDFIAGSKTTKSDLAKHGLQRPAFELRLYADQKEPAFTARFSKPSWQEQDDDDGYHQGSPATLKAMSSDYSEILVVTKSMLDSLQKPAENFYDKKSPFQFASEEVGRIEVDTPDLKGVFVKQDQKWTTDSGEEVDSARLDRAIAKLESMEAIRVLAPIQRSGSKEALKESKLKLLKPTGELLFEIGWGDIVNEKARAGRPESRYLSVRTNRAENRVGLPEGEIKALDLSNWLKPAIPMPTPSSSPSHGPDRVQDDESIGAKVGELKGSSNVRNPGEVSDSRRSGGRHARLLASLPLSR